MAAARCSILHIIREFTTGKEGWKKARPKRKKREAVKGRRGVTELMRAKET